MRTLRKPLPALILVAVLLMAVPVRAQSWQPLNNHPAFHASTALLLTDGRVLCQDIQASDWWALTPDNNGSYINGAWSQIASLPSGYGPLYYASAVLADGRVVVIGGEYNLNDNGGKPVRTNKGALYDPLANTWTSLAAPKGWRQIGDAQCCVLPDGQFLLADPFNTNIALLDPGTLTWTAVSSTGKADKNAEEGWTLLPDGTILTVDIINRPSTEKYIPWMGRWASAGSTPVNLMAASETGPAVLRPDGTVFAAGANRHTALYTPPANPTDPGAWTSGPSFPVIGGKPYGIQDGPACLLPDGNVLCLASPGYHPPSHFFEFDGTNLNQVADTPNAPKDAAYYGRMLLLPTGQVLFTDGSGDVEIYISGGSPNPAWAPTITSCPTSLTSGSSYTISGTQFNGLSQAVAYGDDYQGATNYPLVRITNNATGHVFYCRTHGHSTMAVATGSATVSTNFTVPANIETGDSTLEVVANGIPSSPYPVTVDPILISLNTSSQQLFSSGVRGPHMPANHRPFSGSEAPGIVRPAARVPEAISTFRTGED